VKLFIAENVQDVSARAKQMTPLDPTNGAITPCVARKLDIDLHPTPPLLDLAGH
jgi:hypothetical protein